MPLTVKERLAVVAIVLVYAVNMATRFFTPAVYVYGNIAALIIASIIPLLLSRGINFAISVAVAGVMVNVLFDTLYCIPYEVGFFDLIAYVLLLAVTVIIGYKSGNKTINADTFILLSIIAIKLYAQNSLGEIAGRYICYLGDAAVYLLFAIYTIRQLFSKAPELTLFFLAGTINNFRDNYFGDPYNFHWGEVAVMAMIAIDLLWWYLRKRYAKTPAQRRLSIHILIAMHLLAAGAIAIFLL